jgi:hypothetical protein
LLTFIGPDFMSSLSRTSIDYATLRRQCLKAIRQWPRCETVVGIQIIRDNSPAGFSVKVTLYGDAEKKIADRAIVCVEREMRRLFYLTE